MSVKKIKVAQIVTSPVKKVWDYWNQPEHITKWNFANKDWYCPKATNDLWIGGKLVTRMEAKDGSFGFDFEGVYDEIIPLKKISYNIADGRNVTTTFKDLGDKTKVTTIFDAEASNPNEVQCTGWQAILDNFKGYVENN